MNYEPNTRHWQYGDIVIHDVDAKQSNMLMMVIGYTKDGLAKTQYIHRVKHADKVYENELKYLHDPKLFAILIELDY